MFPLINSGVEREDSSSGSNRLGVLYKPFLSDLYPLWPGRKASFTSSNLSSAVYLDSAS